MNKQTILVTGTPCVGKTKISKRLAASLDALYVNLTELAEKEKLMLKRDEKRKTQIVNETKMRSKLKEIIEKTEKPVVVIDGHYASAVAPKALAAKIFVLRRNPIELKKLMEEAGFEGAKLWENLAAEILDVCLVEALRMHQKEKVCEIDVTGQTVDNIVKEITDILRDQRECPVGCTDWLGMLETQGILDEYLRT